ncbi:MAG: Holliday junction resolvase RuvX [Deltaproteobacteria bacterium]
MLGQEEGIEIYRRIDVTYNGRVTAMAQRAEERDGFTAECESKPRRILAIDYGRKRIGLALSDELGLTAQPLGMLARTNRRNDLRRLREICRKHGVSRIIVGHPLHMTGAAGEMADEAARFSDRLAKELRMKVELVDERLTTWEAERMAAETQSKRRKGRALDDVAAAILLRDYLERRRAAAPTSITEKE